MSSCLGNPRVLCGLLLAGSIVASVAQSRAAAPGSVAPARDLARLVGLDSAAANAPIELAPDPAVVEAIASPHEDQLPEAIRRIVAGLRGRSDGIALLASDGTAAEGERLIARHSTELARDAEAVIARQPP